MLNHVPDDFDTVAPSPADSLLANESVRQFAMHEFGEQSSIRIQLIDEKDKASIAVPAVALRFFVHLLSEMARGNAVTLVPTPAELTTQQAADLLNVSRPYVVKLLKAKKIPSRLVGKYRRVRLDDLLAYKQKDDDARAKILDQLSAETQELGIV